MSDNLFKQTDLQSTGIGGNPDIWQRETPQTYDELISFEKNAARV